MDQYLFLPSFPSDHYIVNVQWVSGGGGEVLSVVWSVRAQNLSVVTHCSKPDSGDRHRWGCSEARNLLSAAQQGQKQSGLGICVVGGSWQGASINDFHAEGEGLTKKEM